MSLESEVKKNTMAITNLHEYMESLHLPELINALRVTIDREMPKITPGPPVQQPVVEPDQNPEPEPPAPKPTPMPKLEDMLPKGLPINMTVMAEQQAAVSSTTSNSSPETAIQVLRNMTDYLNDNGAMARSLLGKRKVINPMDLEPCQIEEIIEEANAIMNGEAQ